MNDRPIDFTSLDPSTNTQRWEARIAFIANRAAAQHRRRLTVMGQLVLWSRPMLAIAASVALIGWIGLAAFGAQQARAKADPAMAITNWAARDEVPSTETVIAALEGVPIDEK